MRSARALLVALLGGCAAVAAPGQHADAIAEAPVAAAYIPIAGFAGDGPASFGAATVVAPGIAVSCAHNADIVEQLGHHRYATFFRTENVIGVAPGYDLIFFKTPLERPPPLAVPAPGERITAYGQGEQGLRIAHGAVRDIAPCAGCAVPDHFTYEGDAGPGFSGGPVLNAAGAVIGITCGYRDTDGKRLNYGYDVGRIAAELAIVSGPAAPRYVGPAASALDRY